MKKLVPNIDFPGFDNSQKLLTSIIDNRFRLGKIRRYNNIYSETDNLQMGKSILETPGIFYEPHPTKWYRTNPYTLTFSISIRICLLELHRPLLKVGDGYIYVSIAVNPLFL